MLIETRPARVALVGDTNAGKTRLLQRCAERCQVSGSVVPSPASSSQQRVGGSFAWAAFPPDANPPNTQLLIHMHDPSSRIRGITAERAKRDPTAECIAMLHETLEQVDIVVIVCDARAYASPELLYKHVTTWMGIVRLYSTKKHVAGMLLLTKMDLPGVISRELVLRFAASNNMNVLHISTEVDQDVDLFMLQLAQIASRLQAYKRSLLLVNRPVCPPECTETRRTHRHVFSEHSADPLGRIEYAPPVDPEVDDVGCQEPGIMCLALERPTPKLPRGSLQMHRQPAQQSLQPDFLRIPMTPVPVYTMQMQPSGVVHALENDEEWPELDIHTDDFYSLGGGDDDGMTRVPHNRYTSNGRSLDEGSSLLVWYPLRPWRSMLGNLFSCFGRR